MPITKHPVLDYALIAEKYPTAVEKLVNWFAGREDVIAGVKSNDMRMEDIPEIAKQITSMVVQYDPRKLYEFFDENDILIYIGGHPDSTDRFVYHNSKVGHSMPAETRVEAEQAAFMDAFDTLEKQLS